MKIPPWSHSSLESFCTCPRKYYHLRVARDVKDLPPSDAVLIGRKMHEAFENAVNLNTALPSDCRQWQDLVDKIKSLPGEKLAEFKFGVDRDMNACEYYDKAVWSRGAADLVVIDGTSAVILDYKTGKRKDSEQLALYAAYAFAKWPFLEQVTTIFVWLKVKQLDKKKYTRADVPDIWKKRVAEYRQLEIAFEKNKWDPKPSGLCRGWCPCTSCEFCGT